jgi:hypothetical protein
LVQVRVLERLLRGSGAAKAVFGQRIVGMGARNLRRGQVHQRHRLPCWGARRGIGLEAMALVNPAGGGQGWPASVQALKAALMLALVG